MADTARSIRQSLKQQLRESKIGFTLVPVPKKTASQGETQRKSKLKNIFTRGPIAFGLVPRPKKPEGYSSDAKPSIFSRRSKMNRDSSQITVTERMDSSRSLSSDKSDEESLHLDELMEEGADGFSVEGSEHSPQKENHESSSTLQASASHASLRCSTASLKGFRPPCSRTVGTEHPVRRELSNRTLRKASSSRSLGNSVCRPKEPQRRESSRTLQHTSSSRNLGNAVTSFGGGGEGTPRLGLCRERYDVEDELEITIHSIASQGRRKKRPSTVDCEQQETGKFQYGHSARNRNVRKEETANRPECRSWVFWTEPCE